MPKWLVIGAIIAVLLVVGALTWLNKRALQDTSEPAVNADAPAAPSNQPPPLTAPTPQGPVVLTAKEPVWFQVYEKGGQTYYSGTLDAGRSFTVPASAKAPLLKTGKPEGLTITVGSAVAPQVGPSAKMASDVSLLGPDLMKGGTATSSAPTSPPTSTGKPASAAKAAVRTSRPATTPAPAPAPSEPATAAAGNTTGE